MGRSLDIAIPRAFLPVLQPARYKGLHGGRGSAKSNIFADLLIERALLRPGLRWVCVREIQKSLEQSVKRLLEDKIKQYQLGEAFVSQHTLIKTPGDGIIIFQGMQDHTADTIKSLEGYDGAWVEEAQTLSARSLTLLRPTIRKEYPDGTTSEMWFSWNPSKKTDPIDDLLRNSKTPMPDSVVIGSTYRDNPWFPEVLRREMEWDRRVDYEKYLHVWEGGYEKRSESRVFKNWRVEEFDTPADAHFHLGSDWGFSVDPATLVRVFEQRIDPVTNQAYPRKRLYVDRERYRVGVEIDQLPHFFDGLVCGCTLDTPIGACRDTMHGWARSQRIIADSSRPDTISYLRRYGYGGMEPAKKGQNSVKEGVMFLQGYDIIIHPRCRHTIDEFENYSFVVDLLTGLVTNVLEDKKNHIIDPMRYALEQLRGALQVRRAVWG
jgi:phage terminase large subunit